MNKVYEKPEIELLQFDIVEPLTDGGFDGDFSGEGGFEEEW